MRVNTNVAALNAWRNLNTSTLQMQKALEKLSSGFRINKAADDAAGLAVSEKMRAQTRGLNQAVRNTQDGIGLLQTAEAAAGQIQDMVQRMRELAVQASSDTLLDSDRAKLNEEFKALLSEVDRTAGTVTFNGRKLINGSSGDAATITAGDEISNVRLTGTLKIANTFTVDVTQLAREQIQTDAATYDNAGVVANVTWTRTAALDAAAANFNGDLTGSETLTFRQNGKEVTIAFNATDYDGATQVKDLTVDQFITYVNDKLAAAGLSAQMKWDSTNSKIAVESNIDGTSGDVTIAQANFATNVSFGFATTNVGGQTSLNAAATITNAATGATLVAGTDYTVEGNVIKGKAGTDLQSVEFTAAKIGGTNATLRLTRSGLTLQVGANEGETINASLGSLTVSSLAIGTLDISTKSGATGALTALDSSLSSLNTERAKIGALQNRLENIVGTLTVQSENLKAAESRIRDVDMAAEMANFTRYQVLTQAGTAMLAQANQMPQSVLNLLR